MKTILLSCSLLTVQGCGAISECTKETEAQKCKDKEPICGDDKFCRGCTSHSECPSQVCKPDGSCAAEADVAYVDNKNPNCSATNEGSQAKPVCQIGDGITRAQLSGKKFIAVAGSATVYASIAITASTTDIGPLLITGPGKSAAPTAKIFQDGSPAVSISATTKSATLVFDGFEIVGSNSGTKTAGITCSQSTNTNVANLTIKNSLIHDSGMDGIKSTDCAIVVQQSNITGNSGVGITSSGTLTVQQSNITGNSGVGITSSGTLTVQQSNITGNSGVGITSSGTLTVQQSNITGNSGVGITSSGTLTVQQSNITGNSGVGITSSGTLTVQQSNITGNSVGGIKIDQGVYAITNSMINLNKGQGVSIDKTATGTFLFNTVAMNQGSGSGSTGIECGNGDEKSIQYSIVFGNKSDGGTQFFGKCKLQQTVVGNDTVPQTDVIKLEPVFKDTADFHLKSNDPANVDCCVDKVTGNGFPDIDFDGSKRPKGKSWDIGAHELQ